MTRGSGVTAAALGAGLLVFAGCADPTRGSPVGAASVGGAAAYAAQIVQETNHVRAVAGRPALRASQCAAAAARARAAQLVGTATLTHLPLAGVIARCPPAGTAAENLSRAS
ncbi:MAG TPA: hypothetical protein VFJ97_11440, partial [Dermatophilaceae bacterium]|nr:hypothetical protein [Dermatophilaceae bacterium]